MDGNLAVDQRRESLLLVLRLHQEVPEAYDMLMPLLSARDVPPELQRELVQNLLAQNDPAMTTFVVRALQQPQVRGSMSAAMLDWLSRNAEGGALAEIVKAWALEPPEGPSERHYRTLVQQVQHRPWDEALFSAMNDPRFRAKGSAQELLVQRVRMSELKRRYTRMAARTDGVAAIQAFIRELDYVPISRGAMIQTVVAYKRGQHRMGPAAELAGIWARDRRNPYLFNIRDYSLLSALADDPQAQQTSRPTLMLRLARAQTQIRRQHPVYRPGGSRTRTSTRLGAQADHLSTADLWRLWLLEEMLQRPRIRSALEELARRDRQDTSAARGGLIVHEGGRAEAKLYPPDPNVADDLRYAPSAMLKRDGRQALCRLICHFERLENADRVGPTPEEIVDAKTGNYCGMTVTTLDAETFCAHYYTPSGVVVSLGKFPFASDVVSGVE